MYSISGNSILCPFPPEKQTLEEVQRNAMKINSLIHQVLNFNRIEDNEDSLLILSRIELVSFSHSLFSVYEEDKRLTFLFETNKAKIYADMDAIKLGVILDSLLSNAVKFTPRSIFNRFLTRKKLIVQMMRLRNKRT